MMKFFQNFRHDWQQNVIKRTPPPRIIKILKNAWQTEQNYTEIFGQNESNSIKHDGKNISTANKEYFSHLRPFQLAYQTIANYSSKNSKHNTLAHQDELSLKKIDPSIVASAKATELNVNKKILINLINRLHFTNGHVSIHIQDKITSEEFFQQGEPSPYLNDKVAVRFIDPDSFDLARHTPLNLVINNHKSLIVFPVDLQFISQESLVFRLPEMAHSYSKRGALRHVCEGVTAEIVQGLLNMKGFLEDINSQDLKICLNSPADFNPANQLFLKLSKDDQTHFMGECRVVRSDNDGSGIVIRPVHSNRPVLKTRKYPNKRVRMTPPPVISFIHPLCGLAIQNKVEDISASGFSVVVPYKESLFIPGMIIPQMTLQLPGMLNNLTCAAQVVYRQEQKNDLAKYGFYILDMSLNDQRFLFDAVSKVVDPHINITGKINMDSLWMLFFESGFIYPDKYGIISPHSETLKETYRKLYERGHDIFTSLTYQDHGRIYGHLSMVMAYENSWIIHHLAARPMRGKHTGLRTLNHFVNYMDCLYRLPVPSKSMRYNLCYYRPNNLFSDYHFGGVYRTFKKRDICSLDLFGYMTMAIASETSPLPEGLKIEPFCQKDLIVLREWYEKMDGGMMLDAYALKYRVAEYGGQSHNITESPMNITSDNITDMYQKIGLKRTSRVFSIKEQETLKAILIVDRSDLGINMSELLNSIKVIVTDNTLSWKKLRDVINKVGKVYETDKLMVLIFPFSYLLQHGVECKKQYYLWVLNANLKGSEMDVIKKQVEISTWKFVASMLKKRLVQITSMR